MREIPRALRLHYSLEGCLLFDCKPSNRQRSNANIDTNAHYMCEDFTLKHSSETTMPTMCRLSVAVWYSFGKSAPRIFQNPQGFIVVTVTDRIGSPTLYTIFYCWIPLDSPRLARKRVYRRNARLSTVSHLIWQPHNSPAASTKVFLITSRHSNVRGSAFICGTRYEHL